MNLSEINKKLEEILEQINALSMQVSFEEEKADEILEAVGNIETTELDMDEMGKKEFDVTIENVKYVYDQAEENVKNIDVLTEDTKVINLKSDVRNELRGKYEEFFKQKEIIETYAEKYDINELLDVARQEIEDNNSQIRRKKELKEEIDNFAKEELLDIKKSKEENRKIEAAMEKIKEINSLRDRKKQIHDEEIKGRLDVEIHKKMNELRTLLDGVSVEFSYDMGEMVNRLSSKKTLNEEQMLSSRKSILDKVAKNGQEDFKNAMKDVDGQKTENFEIFIKNASYKQAKQIEHLKKVNEIKATRIDDIEKDIEMEKILDEKLKDNPNYGVRGTTFNSIGYTIGDAKKTEEYMRKQIEILERNNAAALMPVSRKEQIKAREKYLKEEYEIEDEPMYRHPIIWLRARFFTTQIDKRIAEDRMLDEEWELKELAEEIARQENLKREQEKKDEYQKLKGAKERNAFLKEIYVDNVTRNVLKGKSKNIHEEAYKNMTDEREMDD